MAGTIEELMKIKEEALDAIPTLTEEELFHFNEFLIDLLSAVNREMLYLLIEKYNNYERRNERMELFTKEQLEHLSRSLIYRLRIDPGERSKQYSNAFHEGIVAMAHEYEKAILEKQELLNK